MTARATVGILSGAILILSSFAHAFAGWPPFQRALSESGVPGDLISGLRVGWHFGSLAMFCFGVMTLWLAVKILRGQEISSEPIQVIAVAYFLFGISALLTQGQNLHYVFFVLTALLLGWFGFWRVAAGD